MRRNLLEEIILYNYRYILGYLFLIGAIVYALFWQLGDLLPGISAYEADYVSGIGVSPGDVWSNPLNWPHKLLTLVSIETLGSTAWALRLPTVIFAILGITVFFNIIRHRFHLRIAIITVTLLVVSSWWLNNARIARPEIMLPVMIFLLILFARNTYESRKLYWLIPLSIIIGIGLYIPLFIYIVLIGLITTRSLIKSVLESFKTKWLALVMLIILGSSIPLIIAIIANPELAKDLLGLPNTWPSLYELLKNIQQTISGIFWRGNEFWPLNLGTLPFLDMFTVIIFALGFYHLDQESPRSLTRFLLIGTGLLIVIISLNPVPGNSIILIPLIYLMVAAGLLMLFSQWYTIFPKNPIARMTVFIPTAILLLMVINYHHQRYFVAWPNSINTIKMFSPLSTYLHQYVQEHPEDEIYILVNEDEKNIANAGLLEFKNVKITSILSAVEGQNSIVISQNAYSFLNSNDKKNLETIGKLQPISTQYQTYPNILWVR